MLCRTTDVQVWNKQNLNTSLVYQVTKLSKSWLGTKSTPVDIYFKFQTGVTRVSTLTLVEYSLIPCLVYIHVECLFALELLGWNLSIYCSSLTHYLTYPVCVPVESLSRCYFCDIPLHIGSYTIHRTSLGHARFYCDQHVGRERSVAAAKRLSDLPDSRPSSSIMSDDVGGRAGDGQVRHFPLQVSPELFDYMMLYI